MPDTLNKQAIINLLIDSPLREPIKINLIDIVNNTNEPDLPKVYSTITKELEIFQKATERRMKLADETIAKLGGVTPAENANPSAPIPPATPMMDSPMVPPLETPMVQPAAATTPAPMPVPVAAPVTPEPGLSVPPLDLPPLPQVPMSPTPVMPPLPPTMPAAEPVAPTTPSFQPLGATPLSSTSDEDALAEIQKELDSLKTEAAADVASAAAPAAAPAAPTTPAPQA